MPADTHFEPHHHAWAQLAYSASGMLQVMAAHAGALDEVTYIVPPSRAVWIAPGARHAIHVLEAAEFRTLYMHASVTPDGLGGLPHDRGERAAARADPRAGRPRRTPGASGVRPPWRNW
jgi:hypothetical protein